MTILEQNKLCKLTIIKVKYAIKEENGQSRRKELIQVTRKSIVQQMLALPMCKIVVYGLGIFNMFKGKVW